MYFKFKDIKLFYEKFGDEDKALLILPGWGNNKDTFINIIKFLKNYFTIYIFDYPGFGNSPFPNKDLTLYDYSELFINFMKQNNIENPNIIGHSFGGRLIISMCEYFKINFEKIVLIDSAGIKPKTTIIKKIKQITYKLLKKIKCLIPSKYKEKYSNKLISIFGSIDYKNLSNNMRKTFSNVVNLDLKKYLNSIKSETLIIWGENDLDTPISDAYTMNKRIQDSGLVIIKNAGHFSYLDYPINSILLSFFKQKR